MEAEFIPYEQALALKELGFDEPCIRYYWTDGVFSKTYNEPFNFSKRHCEVSAPLYQQAFRWFREKHRIEGWVQPYLSPEPRRCEAKYWDGGRTPSTGTSIGIYDTFKEAELECLKKLIEIVKEK